jgi:hypothetical protein
MAFAKIDACLVCEGIRPELNNKNILFGFFGITPYVTVRLQHINAPANLCFVFTGGPSIGKFNIRLRLIDPNGIEVTTPANSPPIQGDLNSPRGGTNIFLSFQGILGKTGTFRAGLVVDEVEQYGTTIGIEEVARPTTLVH